MNRNLITLENSQNITNQEKEQFNPAQKYIISLQSAHSKRTVTSYLNNVARIAGHDDLHSMPWHLMKRQHIQAVISKLIELDYSPSTINSYLSALKGVAFESWTTNYITAHEYQMIRHIKSIRGSRIRSGSILTKKQIGKIFNENPKTYIDIRNNALFAVLLSCGLRRNEIVSLNVSSVNFNDNSIKVTGKGNKERLAYLPDKAIEYIKKWLHESLLFNDKPLFTRILKNGTITSSRLTSQAVYYLVRQLKNKLNVNSLTPHDFRRTFATHLLQNGEDVFTVQQAMGHSNVQTTQAYDLRDNDKLKAVANHFEWI